MNLNPLSTRGTPPEKTWERYNASRPQGALSASFRPTPQTYIASLFLFVSLFLILYLASKGLMAGNLPDLEDILGRKETEKKSEEQKSRSTSSGTFIYRDMLRKTQEGAASLLIGKYVSSWNKGWVDKQRPKTVFTPDANCSLGENKKIAQDTGTDIITKWSPNIKIKNHRLDSFVLLSEDRALGDATFHLERDTTMGSWYESLNAAPETPEQPLKINVFVRYAFEFEKRGDKWLITKQVWLGNKPSYIQTPDDMTAESVVMEPGETMFADFRPSREQMQERYDTLMENMNIGLLDTTVMNSRYTLIRNGKDEYNLNQSQQRLTKLAQRVDSKNFKATVDAVSQIGENTAFALVTYRLNLTPRASKNIYTTTWQDRDTWQRKRGQKEWYLLKTERKMPSNISRYYGF
jgi:hypothetical protein